MITSWAPTPFMRSYIPSPRFSRPPSTIRAGNLLATTRDFQAPLARTDMISDGVMDSFPAQNAQGTLRGTAADSCAKSSGLRARSEAMITQRPATGSRLSSGMVRVSGPSDLPIYTIEVGARDLKRERRQRRKPHRGAGRALEFDEELHQLPRLQPQVPERHRPLEDVLRDPRQPHRGLAGPRHDHAQLAGREHAAAVDALAEVQPDQQVLDVEAVVDVAQERRLPRQRAVLAGHVVVARGDPFEVVAAAAVERNVEQRA